MKGLYVPNSPDKEEEILTDLQDYSFKSGNFKNQQVRLYEIFNRNDYSKKKNDGQLSPIKVFKRGYNSQ